MTLLANFFPMLNVICKRAVSSALTNKTLIFKTYDIQSDCDHNTIKTINSPGKYRSGLEKAKIDKWTFIEIKTQL